MVPAPPPPPRANGKDQEDDEPQPIDIRARIAAFSAGGPSSSTVAPGPSKPVGTPKAKPPVAATEAREDDGSSSPPVTSVRNIIAMYAAGGAAAGPSSAGLAPGPGQGESNRSRANSDVSSAPTSAAVSSKPAPPLPPAPRSKPNASASALQPPAEASSGLRSSPSSPRPAQAKPAPPPTPARPPVTSEGISSLSTATTTMTSEASKSPAPPTLPPRKPTLQASNRPRTTEKSRSDSSMAAPVFAAQKAGPSMPIRVVSEGSPTSTRGGVAPALPPRQGTELSSTPSRNMAGRRRGSDSAVGGEGHDEVGLGVSPQVQYVAYRSRSPARVGPGPAGLKPTLGRGPGTSPRPKPAVPAREGDTAASSSSSSAALAFATSTGGQGNRGRGNSGTSTEASALLPSPQLSSGPLPPPPQRTSVAGAASNGGLGLNSTLSPARAASSMAGLGGLSTSTSRDRSLSSASSMMTGQVQRDVTAGPGGRERRGSADEASSRTWGAQRGATLRAQPRSTLGGGTTHGARRNGKRERFSFEEVHLRLEVEESRREGYEKLWEAEIVKYDKWLGARRAAMDKTADAASTAAPTSSASDGVKTTPTTTATDAAAQGEESETRPSNLKERMKAFESAAQSSNPTAAPAHSQPATAGRPGLRVVGTPPTSQPTSLPFARVVGIYRRSRLPDVVLARIWSEAEQSSSRGAEQRKVVGKERFIKGLAAIDEVLEQFARWKLGSRTPKG